MQSTSRSRGNPLPSPVSPRGSLLSGNPSQRDLLDHVCTLLSIKKMSVLKDILDYAYENPGVYISPESLSDNGNNKTVTIKGFTYAIEQVRQSFYMLYEKLNNDPLANFPFRIVQTLNRFEIKLEHTKNLETWKLPPEDIERYKIVRRTQSNGRSGASAMMRTAAVSAGLRATLHTVVDFDIFARDTNSREAES